MRYRILLVCMVWLGAVALPATGAGRIGREHPETLLEQGEQRLRAHAFDRAERDFRRAWAHAETPSQRARAQTGLARVLRQSGRREDAVPLLASLGADEELPASFRAQAFFLKGHCLREQERFGPAVTAYAAAAERATDERRRLAALYYRALALHQDGALEEVLTSYEHLAAMEEWPALADMLAPRIQRLRADLDAGAP